ncbi:hypothetical protein HYC85_029384 [Camellia sinensis]|uniref:DUF4283 domain-containing protein n=1 Tax=Camellia sinensis TaxID=4442 RepID=A0A7J7FXU9_CAMSI|nr:hypothetical protein HYC85_029384 [Camellia sinensis]
MEQERRVWLSCYGVPLNLWSYNTFSSIGKKWGVVTSMDDDTLLRVCEEQIIVSKLATDQCVSQSTEWRTGEKKLAVPIAEDQITDKNSRLEKEDDEVEVHVGKKSDPRSDVAGVGKNLSQPIAEELDESGSSVNQNQRRRRKKQRGRERGEDPEHPQQDKQQYKHFNT